MPQLVCVCVCVQSSELDSTNSLLLMNSLYGLESPTNWEFYILLTFFVVTAFPLSLSLGEG